VTSGELLARFRGLRAVVVGDLMLDEYIFGRASRISPEAPVMVVEQQETAQLPGGAANVALNLRALGAETTVIGIVGDDAAARTLDETLSSNGLAHSLVTDPDRMTTRKTRILADHRHQVLRVDHESKQPVSAELAGKIAAAACAAAKDADVVVFSDYLKGTLCEETVQAIVTGASGRVFLANPKPSSLGAYHGVDLLSLNRVEAEASMAGRVDGENAEDVASQLRTRYQVGAVLITLGEEGMAASSLVGGLKVAAPRVEVYDTAGAGDTVIATVALGLAAVGFQKEIFELAAKTAACVVRRVGVATPSAEDLAAIAG
jgi:rfaE bifunctional protein kinase chain/domain